MIENKLFRLIRRYPNRRLYDVDLSKYINFSDLHQLILDGIEFKVIEETTKEDQTKSIMLKIFFDLELGGEPLFSDQFLKNIIILNNSAGGYLVNPFLNSFTKYFDDIDT